MKIFCEKLNIIKILWVAYNEPAKIITKHSHVITKGIKYINIEATLDLSDFKTSWFWKTIIIGENQVAANKGSMSKNNFTKSFTNTDNSIALSAKFVC